MHDSHTHLTIEPLKGKYKEHIKEFTDLKGKYILNVAHDIESISEVITQSIECDAIYPGVILTGLGFHPEYISEIKSEYLHKEIDKILEHIEELLETHTKRVFAIGECGLDYNHLYSHAEYSKEDIEKNIEAQKYSFRKHIEIAVSKGLPLSMHTRDPQESSMCVSDALKILSTTGSGRAKGVFHSYTGDIKMVEDILALGFYVGFNGIITYPKAENVREILRIVPIDRILTETDAPLLPPQKVRSGKSGKVKYGKPADILEIMETISQIKEIPIEKLEERLNENFQNLFLAYK